MKEMVSSYIIPNYIGTAPEDNYLTIKTAGVMESRLAESVKELMEKYSNSYRFAFLPHYNGVSFRIRKLGEKNDFQDVKNDFFKVLNIEFNKFLTTYINHETKEFLLPSIINKLISTNADVYVETTDEKWFGITFKEDKKFVKEKIKKLIKK